MKTTGLLLIGLGGGLLYLITRPATASAADASAWPGSDSPASPPGAYSYYDPLTGQTLDGSSPYVDPNHFIGPPAPMVPGNTPAFSPDFERALLAQNDEANRLAIAQQRKQTRASNIEAAVVGAAVAVPVLVRGLPAVARGIQAIVRPAAQGIVRAVPSMTAAPVVRAAAVAGAGVALGTATVAVLDKSGVLDRVQAYGQAQGSQGTAKQVQTIKRIALPLSVPGAIITAAVGRGSVSGNLRRAFAGTNLRAPWGRK